MEAVAGLRPKLAVRVSDFLVVVVAVEIEAPRLTELSRDFARAFSLRAFDAVESEDRSLAEVEEEREDVIEGPDMGDAFR